MFGSSKDTTVNENCRSLIPFCKASSLRIRIKNDKIDSDKNIGNFTCFKSTGRSVVDYVLCKPYLMSRMTSFDILEPNMLMDSSTIF